MAGTLRAMTEKDAMLDRRPVDRIAIPKLTQETTRRSERTGA